MHSECQLQEHIIFQELVAACWDPVLRAQRWDQARDQARPGHSRWAEGGLCALVPALCKQLSAHHVPSPCAVGLDAEPAVQLCVHLF